MSFTYARGLIRAGLAVGWVVFLGVGLAAGCSKILGIEDWPPSPSLNTSGPRDADAGDADGDADGDVDERGDADGDVWEGRDADTDVNEGGDADADVYDAPDVEAEADVYNDHDGDAEDADADADADAGDADAFTCCDPAYRACAPMGSELWARWPMPNPDAALAPSSDASLPNSTAYDAQGEAGIVLDLVTRLNWETGLGSFADNYDLAVLHCATLSRPDASGWRVPTRIELVSLLDLSRPPPMLDTTAFSLPADASAPLVYWTSSVLPDDAGSCAAKIHWFVSFDDGTVRYRPSPNFQGYVRCVQGVHP